jgi:hypothetical protein
MKPVFVTWTDATSFQGWQNPETTDFGPLKVDSVGLLLKKTADIIVLVQSDASNGAIGGCLTIPRSRVVKLRYLK